MTWRDELLAARRQGFDVLDWLSASDDPVTVTACLIKSADPTTFFMVSAPAPVESVIDLFPSAAWHEREVAESFGVEIIGHQTHPLLLPSGSPPRLRKEEPLPQRMDTPWPGAVDPAKPRRTQKPPGTPWT